MKNETIRKIMSKMFFKIPNSNYDKNLRWMKNQCNKINKTKSYTKLGAKDFGKAMKKVKWDNFY